MSIYAISDLHLAFNKNKPMEVFGDNWKDHHKKIREDWRKRVTNSDLVLLPRRLFLGNVFRRKYRRIKIPRKLTTVEKFY